MERKNKNMDFRKKLYKSYLPLNELNNPQTNELCVNINKNILTSKYMALYHSREFSDCLNRECFTPYQLA